MNLCCHQLLQIKIITKMKLIITIFTFIIWSSFSFFQANDYKIYQEAISIIKNSSNYIKYIEEYNYKNKISVADGFYPICAFCEVFKNEITCCKPVKDITELFQGLGEKGLKNLSDVGKSKITLYFTITENNYFVVEIISNKKKHKTLSYLFKNENKKLDLIKVIENN